MLRETILLCIFLTLSCRFVHSFVGFSPLARGPEYSNDDLDNSSDVDSDEFEQIELVPLNDYRKYVIGRRERGDSLKGHTSKNQRYPAPHDVRVDIRYPSSGFGALVTYVEVSVNQTSTIGRAYVTGGGLHQHFISIAVEANYTSQMDYAVLIYGI